MKKLGDIIIDRFSKISERTELMILAVAVGLGSGFAAVALKKIISLVHHYLVGFADMDGRGYLLLILPGFGMLISLIIVLFLIKDDIGHGVTKVLKAVSTNESHIKGHNMWSSLLTSSITIGFGGSVGAEAPIVYTGAAIGSNVARAMKLPYKDMTILLGCGAAGAVAGIFKAPLAGVLFTLEILMFNLSMTSIVPILLSSVTAMAVSSFFLGSAVPFSNTIEAFSWGNVPYYILLGVFSGFVSLYFIRATLFSEEHIKRVKSIGVRWLLCSVALGVLILFFPQLYGEGYDSITMMLNLKSVEMAGDTVGSVLLSNEWSILLFFVAILLLKVFATALTNAGGGVGGTFGPTLFTGAIAGFVLARLINLTGIHVVPEANFVLVGMAGLMAGVMQAPMTAIFLIAEITGGYELFIPLIITSAISFATIHAIEPYSIYTKRLAQQGALLTHDSDKAVLTLLKTSELVESDFAAVNVSATLADLVKLIAASRRNIFPVVDDDGHFLGIVSLDDVREIMFDKSRYDSVKIISLMKSSPAFVYDDEQMSSVMSKFEHTKAWNLPVVDDDNRYLGFVSRSKILFSYRDQLHQVSHD